MPDANDMDLVREFARHNSETAITELVRRHINLVYSVARRCTGNDGDAHDVTQAVFIILARKAAGLREKTLLTGWLYETTRFAAARLLRTNARRHAREQEAYMQSTLNEADHAAVWEKLSPHLEAAMGKLNAAADRALLVLRFYENKSGPEAAALLGIREDAAHKRVTRAIEKLRKVFAQRGVTLTATAIAGAVSANSVQAAPVALVKTISAIAMAKGAAATTSTLTLVKGALKIMAWTKAKMAIVFGGGVLLIGGAAGLMIFHSNSSGENSATYIRKPDEPEAVAILQNSLTKYAAMTSYSDTGIAIYARQNSLTNTFKTKLGRPNYYLVEWDQRTLPELSFKGAVWFAGDGNFLFNAAVDGDTIFKKMQDAYSTQVEGMGFSGEAAFYVPSFFQEAKTKRGRVSGSLAKNKDDMIDGIDCCVLTETLKDRTITRWIGKQDLLIYRIQTRYSTIPSSKPTLVDDATIQAALVKLGKPVSPDSIASMRTQIEEVEQNSQKRSGNDYTVTEIHQNIVVNQPFTKEDFTYQVPAGLKPSE